MAGTVLVPEGEITPRLGRTRHERNTTMNRIGVILATGALVLSACSSGTTTETEVEETSPPATEPAVETTTTLAPEPEPTGSTITLVDSEFGEILADADGNTLYMFVPDAKGDSVCYGDCEAAWPIFYSPSEAGDGLDASLLGSVDRTDDTVQATYGDWPLYYFADDAAPGEVNGQGRGDVWYVVNAAGEALVAQGEVLNQLTLVDSEFGEILADADGNTLYMFVPDAKGDSVCYGDCENAWPIFYGPAWSGAGVDGEFITLAERTDGTKQLVYNGWALYYFVDDVAPGDTNGQGRGDVWYVVNAAGDALVADGEVLPQLTLVDSEYGEILADAEGNTLYLFTPDAQGPSTCYDDCEANWPVFFGPAWVGEGVDGELGELVERNDATKQLSYNGWPLYYFANDAAPGDTNGQGAGDVWYVINAAGELVEG